MRRHYEVGRLLETLPVQKRALQLPQVLLPDQMYGLFE
jgi:hypothetical protein